MLRCILMFTILLQLTITFTGSASEFSTLVLKVHIFVKVSVDST